MTNKQDAAELKKDPIEQNPKVHAWITRLAATRMELSLADWGDFVCVIREALRQNAGAVDIEAIKADALIAASKDPSFITCLDSIEWTIDHLASRGLLKSQEGAGECGECGGQGFNVGSRPQCCGRVTDHGECRSSCAEPEAYQIPCEMCNATGKAALSQPQRVGQVTVDVQEGNAAKVADLPPEERKKYCAHIVQRDVDSGITDPICIKCGFNTSGSAAPKAGE